jgi:hypothetical protein
MTDTNERVLGWDDEISNDDQSPAVLLKPGDHDGEIVSLRKGRHQAKADAKANGKLPDCPKAEVTVRFRQDGEDVDVKTNLFLHSRCEWMLCQFFRSIGQRTSGEPLRPKWNEVIGSRCRCKTKQRNYTKADGEKGTANEIVGFIDPKPGGQQPPATQPPAEANDVPF